MTLNLEAGKTEAMVISLDPRETAGKATPHIHINHEPVLYTKNPTMLGVTKDPQLNFTEHARLAASNMAKRNSILATLSGKDWGLLANDLRHLYTSYVRPGGCYGAGVFFHFLSDSSAKKLESANYTAARAITGAPKGSPAAATCREAGLPKLRFNPTSASTASHQTGERSATSD